jgi:hypothetical protein
MKTSKAYPTLIVIVALLQTACATTNLTDFRTVQLASDGAAERNKPFTRLSDIPLRSGQIVVSEAGSSTSFMMNLMAAEYAPYGHAGIIVREAGGVFVYEAFGFLNFRIWEPPTRRLRGKIRRVPLIDFLARGTTAAIYQHDDIELDAIAAYAIDAYEKRLAFDGMFDYRTASSVYCSEFVAAALIAAGHAEITPTSRTKNSSLNRTMEWLDVDTPGFILAAHLLTGATEIARFSKRYTASQVDAHFAYERELHRRFSIDQKLGNVFRWTFAGPRFRPHLARLRGHLMNGANSVDDVNAWVAQEVASFLDVKPSEEATTSSAIGDQGSGH